MKKEKEAIDYPEELYVVENRGTLDVCITCVYYNENNNTYRRKDVWTYGRDITGLPRCYGSTVYDVECDSYNNLWLVDNNMISKFRASLDEDNIEDDPDAKVYIQALDYIASTCRSGETHHLHIGEDKEGEVMSCPTLFRNKNEAYLALINIKEHIIKTQQKEIEELIKLML